MVMIVLQPRIVLSVNAEPGNDQEVNFHEIEIHFFMRSKFIFSWGQIHEIKFFFIFHEVEIPYNDSISWSALFSLDRNSKKALFIRQFWSHDQFASYKYNHEIEIQKAVLGISISWSIC